MPPSHDLRHRLRWQRGGEWLGPQLAKRNEGDGPQTNAPTDGERRARPMTRGMRPAPDISPMSQGHAPGQLRLSVRGGFFMSGFTEYDECQNNPLDGANDHAPGIPRR